MRIAVVADVGDTAVDLENDEWLPLRIDRPPRGGEGECSWLDTGETGLLNASPVLVSSGVDKVLSTGMVSGLELPVAAEIGVRTAPLDSVSIDEIEVRRERLGTGGGGAVCGVGLSEGRPRWLDRRACRCCLLTIANQANYN